MENNYAVAFTDAEFDGDVAGIIQSFVATGIVEEDTYNKLASKAITCATSDQFRNVLFNNGEKETGDWLEQQPGNAGKFTYRKKGFLDTAKGYNGYKIDKIFRELTKKDISDPNDNGKSTYTATKNVICNALDAGIQVQNADGTLKGKTALEKATAEANEAAGLTKSGRTKNEKTEYEKAMAVVSTLSKIYHKLEPDEQADIRVALKDEEII